MGKIKDNSKTKATKKKPNGYWNNYTKCKEAVLLCKTRSELHKNYGGAYNKIIDNNWIDLFDSYLPSKHKVWTYDDCKEEALKYKHRGEMWNVLSNVCSKILKNGWDKELFKHMLPIGSRKKRLIYVYEFADKSCYIGLTGNAEKREDKHTRTDLKCIVYKYIQKNIPYNLIIKTDYIKSEDASLLEGVILNEYKNNGWNILNIAKTGGLGGNIKKYDFNTCVNEAKKYKTKKEFIKKSPQFYSAIIQNDFIDELYIILGWKKKLINYWTFEKCKEEALKFDSLKKFTKNSKSCYKFSYKNGFLTEITKHMKKRFNRGYWTFEQCMEEAKKHNSKTDFKINSNGAYNSCRRNKWLTKIYENLF